MNNLRLNLAIRFVIVFAVGVSLGYYLAAREAKNMILTNDHVQSR